MLFLYRASKIPLIYYNSNCPDLSFVLLQFVKKYFCGAIGKILFPNSEKQTA